jgi:hypothetical protein
VLPHEKWRNMLFVPLLKTKWSSASVLVCVWRGGEHADHGPFWHRVVSWVRTDVSEKRVATGSFVAPEAS